MDTEEIIQELEAERDRLDAAIAALQGVVPRIGRRGPRQMSPEARARIAEAQRKRWAARKKGQGSVASAETSDLTPQRRGPRHLTAAAGQRIAAAQRARWAKIRAGGKKK